MRYIEADQVRSRTEPGYVQQIRDTGPNMTELALHLEQSNGQSPLDTLNLFSSTPRLRRVDLQFELFAVDSNTPVESNLEAAEAK